MKGETGHEWRGREWAELAPAYAIGALDAQDRAAFAVHVAGCARCRAELRRYAGISALIAGAAPEATAPASLRERIVAEARGASVPRRRTAKGSVFVVRQS